MRRDSQLLELCDRFFDSIEQKDYDTLESCYAPEAVVWHSHDGRYQPRADNLAMLKQGMETQSKTRFKERRIRTFEGGFVQQHTIHVTREDGFQGHMEVCFIGYVRDGRISRAYEYFDTGQIEKFIGPQETTRMTDGPPKEGLFERVAAVLPLIAERSFEAEAQRRPADDVIEALKATGVFRSFVPARYGGYEIDLSTYLDIGIAVAHADPSMGWITTFYMEHNWLVGMFPDELQEEIFGSQPYILAPGSVNPTGRATPQPDGGYLLSGHWQFGTGICHADWVLLSGKVEGADPPLPRNFLVHLEDVEVKDTWHVDGMAATGSRDIIATDVFVPEHRISLPIPPFLLAGPDAPYLLRIPLGPFLSLTAAMPAVGAAQRAVELFRALMFDRTQYGTTRTQSTRVPAQVRLANLVVEVDAAELLLRGIAGRMQAHADGAVTYSLAEQQQHRLAIAHVVRRCHDVVRDVMQSSGASVHYLDNELQRIHRDVHMICAHTVFDVDLLAEGIGRELVKPPVDSIPTGTVR